MSIRAFLSFSIVPLIAAATLTACGPDSPSHGEAVVRDSAGVRIVENSAPAWREGEGWRMSDEPILEIGVLEGQPEYQLFQVRGAIRLSDGRIVVANAGSHELRIYDPRGRFLTSVGREGSGPGEFRALGSLDRLGSDSLITWDWRNNRAQVFDDATLHSGRQTRRFPQTRDLHAA